MFHILSFFTLAFLPFINEMPLAEKVGQVLMVHFHGEVANEEARTLIQDTGVGGVIYYNWSNGLTSPEQVRDLSAGLQKLAKKNMHPIPLLIAVDQEGGVVARLDKGFTIFPGNKAIAMSGNPSLAETSAFAMGKELLAVGITMNLAPVVDVNCNPKNPVIGLRSFGDSPEIVSVFGKNALEGFRRAGILTTLKHYPGHGDVEVDSHEGLPVVRKSMQELKQVELLPFAKLSDQTDAIMTAHLLVPSFDPENCSTLSKKTLDYLRNQIGFQGVVITDSLVMEGVLKKCGSVDEAAIQAINAGCDLILLGGKQLFSHASNFELTVTDVQRIHQSIMDAVKNGHIAEERLNQAVARVLKLKEKHQASQLSISEVVHATVHRAIAEKIASLALEVDKRDPPYLTDLHLKKVSIFAPKIMQASIEQTSLLNIGRETDVFYFAGLNPTAEEINAAEKQAEMGDVLLFCSYNAWKNTSQSSLIHSLLWLEKPTILAVLRDPLDVALFPEANLIFTTFSPTAPAIEAMSQQLALSISPQDAEKIGEKIWRNECGGKFENLTHWNLGENFASLGIGHFIWYPAGKKERFQEDFPNLLRFLEAQKEELPFWLKNARECPWSSREGFYRNIDSQEMIALRKLLYDTKKHQALFIAKRLEKALPQMTADLSLEEKEQITVIFYRLAKEAQGLYALIDYLNFKGLGISPEERYHGEGWGLLQVLQNIPPKSLDPLSDFIESAKALLAQRVKNAPPERHEEKWLLGWYNRLDTYIVDSI